MTKATIVTDLGFGDAGKGSIVDYLCHASPSTVVRFNGGAQAAHNVVTPLRRHHTFSQFGSGSLQPGTRTFLSRFMLVDPLALHNEAQHLMDIGAGHVFDRLAVDANAKIVTPFQKAANRIRESLRDQRHGSCGQGIGETMADSIASLSNVLYASTLLHPGLMRLVLRDIQKRKLKEFKSSFSRLDASRAEDVKILTDESMVDLFAGAMHEIAKGFQIVDGIEHLREQARSGDLVFEGAQGVLLDEWYGFHPYTTWSTTTDANARTLLREAGYESPIETIGVIRAYQTRHGAGPFPTESSVLASEIPDTHNGMGEWQGAWRVGWLDAVLTRYAIAVNHGVDSIAVTNLDRLEGKGRAICVGYEDRERNHTHGNLVPKGTITDLAYQEELTALLFRVKPILIRAPKDDDSYLNLLREQLGAPISIVSRGPAWDDKTLLRSAPKLVGVTA